MAVVLYCTLAHTHARKNENDIFFIEGVNADISKLADSSMKSDTQERCTWKARKCGVEFQIKPQDKSYKLQFTSTEDMIFWNKSVSKLICLGKSPPKYPVHNSKNERLN